MPDECVHNAHMYYILLDSLAARTQLIEKFKKQDIHPVFHYIPLHSAPAGIKYARTHGDLTLTNSLSERLLRLPLWIGLESAQHQVLSVLGVNS